MERFIFLFFFVLVVAWATPVNTQKPKKPKDGCGKEKRPSVAPSVAVTKKPMVKHPMTRGLEGDEEGVWVRVPRVGGGGDVMWVRVN